MQLSTGWLLLVALSVTSICEATSGRFIGPRDLQVGSTPILPYVTDLNHDGIPDIVMATYGGVAVLLGKGSGVFATPFYASHNLTTSLAIADFNGDGELDIVANI